MTMLGVPDLLLKKRQDEQKQINKKYLITIYAPVIYTAPCTGLYES
jgi:hypothetical protein